VLREIVLPPSLLTKLLNVAGPNFTATFNSATGMGSTGSALSSPIPWRKQGIKYAANEIYFDIIEDLHAIINKSAMSLSRTCNPSFLYPASFVDKALRYQVTCTARSRQMREYLVRICAISLIACTNPPAGRLRDTRYYALLRKLEYNDRMCIPSLCAVCISVWYFLLRSRQLKSGLAYHAGSETKFSPSFRPTASLL